MKPPIARVYGIRVRWACLLVIAAGCGASFDGPPAVDVGTGVDQFVALHDGDPVPIIHGIQGGYHVWGSVRAHNLAPSDVKLRFTLTRVADGAAITLRTDTVDLDDSEHLGSAVFLPDPDAVRGQACRLHLDVTDSTGRAASSEHLITPE